MARREGINPDAVYSREEVARLLGVSLSTVKRLISSGQLAASRPAGLRRVFIRGTSVLEMLETTRINGERDDE
ncbi:helix-turn-helix domain-containing protein [Chloroflexus sp.]|uniref:helix-turn-helix domain-containing protein n=1 Tax=Chloroflexus sp. TaxID=1904827 RepID=UPI002ACD4EC1|nr:helix-turn-helix domain-containing protein [Chloroflexus sp.]